MFQPIVDVMEKFATDFTWKRLIIFLSFIILIVFAFLFYESQTSTNQLSKYERTVVLLEKLNSLKQDNNQTKTIITHIYSGLENITNPLSDSVSFSLDISRELKQGLFSSLPWILVILISLPGVLRGEKDSRNLAVGSTILGIIIGFIGYFIPLEWSPMIGLALYPILINILTFAILIAMGSKK